MALVNRIGAQLAAFKSGSVRPRHDGASSCRQAPKEQRAPPQRAWVLMAFRYATRAMSQTSGRPPSRQHHPLHRAKSPAHVLRSLLCVASPEEHWLWRCGGDVAASLMCVTSFQVRWDDSAQLGCDSGAFRAPRRHRVHDVVRYVIFHHLGGQAIGRPRVAKRPGISTSAQPISAQARARTASTCPLMRRTRAIRLRFVL